MILLGASASSALQARRELPFKVSCRRLDGGPRSHL